MFFKTLESTATRDTSMMMEKLMDAAYIGVQNG